MDFEIIGVYSIKNVADAHLIEIQVKDSIIPLNLHEITQPIENLDRLNWQIPYKEYLLNITGEIVISNEWENISDEKLTGSFRIVFFFHFLNIKRPLSTQFGDYNLPPITNLPERLSVIHYTKLD
ncbi:hypothetical protein EHR01_10605 [Leptospira mtsangambouensis]|uniref:Uncharacterized protein n=1 Tax=Leptospira mtsangambouensis TaxID=2484912 RepID=A0ABY2NZR8_9LEPT|nr:hypothetical protein [Leptospira mtsangambouensis]TGM74402.1 hypothetical protein EHR01_10605 [Leptospira mtsangambouensis]